MTNGGTAFLPWKVGTNLPGRLSRLPLGLLGLWSVALAVFALGLHSVASAMPTSDHYQEMQSKRAQIAPASTPDASAAVVMRADGVPISIGQWRAVVNDAFSARARSGLYQGGSTQDTAAINRQAMHLLVDPIALQQLARGQGISTDEHELYAAWLTHASSNERKVAEQRGSEAVFVQEKADLELRAEVAQRLITQPRVDRNAVFAYYHAHPEQFARAEPQVHVREIVLPTKQSADAVIAELDQGVAFPRLAAAYSLDASYYRDRGGDLGWIGARAMPPEWMAHALVLDRGQTSPVFTLWGSYYILQSVDKPDYEPAPFSVVSDQAQTALIHERVEDALDRLLAEHERSMHIVAVDPQYVSTVRSFRTSLLP